MHVFLHYATTPVNCLLCNTANGVLVGDTCFVVFQTLKTWSQAKEDCMNHGMVLAVLKDQAHAKGAVPNISDYVWVDAYRESERSPLLWFDDKIPVAREFVIDGEYNDWCGLLTLYHMVRMDACEYKAKFLCMAKSTVFAVPGLLQCNCLADSCVNDKCAGVVKRCRKNYFGPYCQYRNLIVANDDHEMTDHDEKTCTAMDSAGKISDEKWLNLLRPEVFYWASVSYNGPSSLDWAFWMQLYRKETFFDCEKSKDKFFCCSFYTPVDKIKIIWWTGYSICDLKIYGGRNVAFMQTATASSTLVGDPALALDGVKMTVADCFRTRDTRKEHFVEVIFRKVYYIFSVHVYGSPVSHFKLSCYNKRDRLLPYCHYKPTIANNSIYYPLVNGIEMKKIRLSMRNPARDRYMEICEIEAYGDCSTPYYGVFCNMTCNTECVLGQCAFTGDCFFIYRYPDPVPWTTALTEPTWVLETGVSSTATTAITTTTTANTVTTASNTTTSNLSTTTIKNVDSDDDNFSSEMLTFGTFTILSVAFTACYAWKSSSKSLSSKTDDIETKLNDEVNDKTTYVSGDDVSNQVDAHENEASVYHETSEYMSTYKGSTPSS